MPDHPAPSITTAEFETGTDFVAAPSGLSAAVMVHHGTIVRRRLGPIVGYARFDGIESEAVYASASGLHRARITSDDLRHDKDATLGILG